MVKQCSVNGKKGLGAEMLFWSFVFCLVFSDQFGHFEIVRVFVAKQITVPGKRLEKNRSQIHE